MTPIMIRFTDEERAYLEHVKAQGGQRSVAEVARSIIHDVMADDEDWQSIGAVAQKAIDGLK